MNVGCVVSARGVAERYARKTTTSQKVGLVVSSYDLGDVVVYDPKEMPGVAAVGCVTGTFRVSSADRTISIPHEVVMVSYTRDGSFHVTEDELVRVGFSVMGRVSKRLGGVDFGELKRALTHGLSVWRTAVGSTLHGSFERRITDVYPVVAGSAGKRAVDNEFKKASFLNGLRLRGYDARWAKNVLVERGSKLDEKLRRYVESRVATLREESCVSAKS